MHSGILWQTIYWSPILVLAALIVILLRRRLAREFPLFFSYVVVDWAKNVAGFVMYYEAAGNRYSLAYGYTYWISHLISAVFILFATYELSIMRLFPKFYKVNFYRQIFPVAALLAAGLGAFAMYGIVGMSIMPRTIHVLDVLQVVALLFFVGLMQLMGRLWSRYEFAIALGLGVNAVAFVIFFVSSLKWGTEHSMLELPSIANALACLIWLISFWHPERPLPVSATQLPPEVLRQARKWEETLKESLAPKRPPT